MRKQAQGYLSDFCKGGKVIITARHLASLKQCEGNYSDS